MVARTDDSREPKTEEEKEAGKKEAVEERLTPGASSNTGCVVMKVYAWTDHHPDSEDAYLTVWMIVAASSKKDAAVAAGYDRPGEMEDLHTVIHDVERRVALTWPGVVYWREKFATIEPGSYQEVEAHVKVRTLANDDDSGNQNGGSEEGSCSWRAATEQS